MMKRKLTPTTTSVVPARIAGTAVAVLLAAATAQAAATSGTWTNPATSTDSWTTASNWSITSGSGSYPGGADGVATFTNPGSNYTVDIGTNPISIGSIDASFNGNHGLTITSGTLNFATSTGTPGLTWSSTVGGPVVSFSGLTVTGNQGLVITGSANMNTSFRTYGNTIWSGFSGTVALTQGNWDPQQANAAPANSDLILGGTDTNSTNDTGTARFGLFGGRNQTIGALTGGSASYLSNNSSTTATTLTIGNNNDSGNFAGNIGQHTGGQPTGTGVNINVVKTGTGTETFSGTDSYTGSTTINAGTLAVTGSLSGGGLVTVKSGGTLAGTGGIIAGAVALSGGSINLSDSTIGNLTLQNGLTMTSGSLAFEIGSGGASDLIDVTGGSVSATGAVTVNIAGLSGFGAGTYDLISGTSSGLGNLSLGTTPGGAFNYALQSGTNGEQLVVSAVPEPAPIALIAAGGLGLLLLNRKKRLA
jgi:autotransporter-associated beta strand protein